MSTVVPTLATLNDELYLLEAMVASKEEKASLPKGLQFLDRGGLTFPKETIIPYLRVVEERMLDVLSKDNYRRYGEHLFEVSTQNTDANHYFYSIHSV